MLSRIYTSNICSCSNRSLTSLISKKFQQNYYKVVHSNCITSRNFVSSSNMSKTISYVTDIEGMFIKDVHFLYRVFRYFCFLN